MAAADRFTDEERTGVALRVLFGVPGPVPDTLQPYTVPVHSSTGRHIGWDLDLAAVFHSDRPAILSAFTRWRGTFESVTRVSSLRLWRRFCGLAADMGVELIGSLSSPPVSVDTDQTAVFQAAVGKVRRWLPTGPGGWVLVDTRTMNKLRTACPAGDELIASGEGWTLTWTRMDGLVMTSETSRAVIIGWELTGTGLRVFDLDDVDLQVPDELASCLTLMAPSASEVAVAPAGPEMVFGPCVVALNDALEVAAAHRVPARLLVD